MVCLLTDDQMGADFISSPDATISVVPGQSITLAFTVGNGFGENINVRVHTNIPDTYVFGELFYTSFCSSSLCCQLDGSS